MLKAVKEMKNHFGEFDEGVLKALRDAYNPDANSFAESYDFKTCQRSDGTTYGTHGDCVQKGSKEVSKSSSKKKTSKKSSWDPSNLAGKMGIEISKVAGRATGNDPGVAVQRHVDKMKKTEKWYAGAEKKMFAGKLSVDNYVQTLVSARAQAAQAGAQAMREANRLVASGEADSSYSRGIYKWVKENVDSYDKNINTAVSNGMLPAPPQIESIPKPATTPKASPAPYKGQNIGGDENPNVNRGRAVRPRSDRGSGRSSSSGSGGSLQDQIMGAMNDVLGPGLMGAVRSQGAAQSRWGDGLYRTSSTNGRNVKTFRSYDDALRDAQSGWGQREIKRP